MVIAAGRSSYSTTALAAAARAAAIEVAATANRLWPTQTTSPSANSLSSWITGLTSFSPGMSWAVSTIMTPGEARTADRSIDTIRAWAFLLMPRWTWSMPAGSGMSST
jgi:hypothetical protein